MRAFLLAFLFASSAAAQTPDSTAGPRRGPSAGLVLGGAAAGVVAVLIGNAALQAVGADADGSVSILLYPAGAAVGVVAVGRRQGRHGTARGAALGAVRGTLFAAGGVLLIGYGVGNLFNEGDDNSAALLAGLAIALVAPPYAAAAGYAASDVQPVVLRGPDGERAAGLSLRLAL